jgi:protein-tyrosine-phosphatase
MFIESGNNDIERSKTCIINFVIPSGKIKSCSVFGKAFVENHSQRVSFDHIPDPYYEGIRGFDYVIDLLEDAWGGLYNKIK